MRLSALEQLTLAQLTLEQLTLAQLTLEQLTLAQLTLEQLTLAQLTLEQLTLAQLTLAKLWKPINLVECRSLLATSPQHPCDYCYTPKTLAATQVGHITSAAVV
jgi:hypothetical protein